jgi:hypothetical protein
MYHKTTTQQHHNTILYNRNYTTITIPPFYTTETLFTGGHCGHGRIQAKTERTIGG